MRYTKTVVIEKEVEVYKCDFCDLEVEKGNNRGCCGTSPIKWCDFCGKECCTTHRKLYWENEWEDYPDFCACQDCIEKVDMCEHVARQVAGRYDGWLETVKKIYDNIDEYRIYLDDYEPEEPEPTHKDPGKARAAKTVKINKVDQHSQETVDDPT